jgi:hypothetical protein
MSDHYDQREDLWALRTGQPQESKQSSDDWLRSERARCLRWLAGELESGGRSVSSWTATDTDEGGELFVIEVRRNG